MRRWRRRVDDLLMAQSEDVHFLKILRQLLIPLLDDLVVWRLLEREHLFLIHDGLRRDGLLAHRMRERF